MQQAKSPFPNIDPLPINSSVAGTSRPARHLFRSLTDCRVYSLAGVFILSLESLFSRWSLYSLAAAMPPGNNALPAAITAPGSELDLKALLVSHTVEDPLETAFHG